MNIPTETPARFTVTPAGEPTLQLGETAPIEQTVPVYTPYVPHNFEPPERIDTSPVGEKLQPEETLQLNAPQELPAGIRRAQEHTGNILALGALVEATAAIGITGIAISEVEEQAIDEQHKPTIRQA